MQLNSCQTPRRNSLRDIESREPTTLKFSNLVENSTYSWACPHLCSICSKSYRRRGNAGACLAWRAWIVAVTWPCETLFGFVSVQISESQFPGRVTGPSRYEEWPPTLHLCVWHTVGRYAAPTTVHSTLFDLTRGVVWLVGPVNNFSDRQWNSWTLFGCPFAKRLG